MASLGFMGQMGNQSQGLNSRMLRTATVEGQPSNANQRSYVDVNENGSYDPTEDRVIISDMDGNGVLNNVDAHRTSRALNLMRNQGQPDLNGDGRVSEAERREATAFRPFGTDASRLDRNGDGKLDMLESMWGKRGCQGAQRLEGVTLATDQNNDGVFRSGDLGFNNTHMVTGVQDGRVSFTPRMAPPQGMGTVGSQAGHAVSSVATGQGNRTSSTPAAGRQAPPSPSFGQRALRALSTAADLANPLTTAQTVGRLFNDQR